MKIDKIIDFHIHIFPDILAERAISSLCARAKAEPYTDGRLDTTLKVLDEWNTDYGVSLNISVLPKSLSKVNDYAIATNGGRIISFGSAHPDSNINDSELERLKAAGVKGIKMHPEYQEFEVNDTKAINIYRKCGELGLIVLLHSGTDIAYPDTLRAAPKAILDAVENSPETKFVCAHMGGHDCWEDVYTYLAGHNRIWLDTSYTARELDKGLFMKIVDKHSHKRILYATDMPWESGLVTQQYLYNMGYTNEQLSDIMYNNAYELLGGVNG